MSRSRRTAGNMAFKNHLAAYEEIQRLWDSYTAPTKRIEEALRLPLALQEQMKSTEQKVLEAQGIVPARSTRRAKPEGFTTKAKPAEPYRPESRDAGQKGSANIAWAQQLSERKVEPSRPVRLFDPRVPDLAKDVEALKEEFRAAQAKGMYCLTFDWIWVKFGYTSDLGADNDGNRLKKHLKDGWMLQATKRGMDQQKDEKRIRDALKRRGHQLMPGTNEVFRITRELIQDAIDLGAPLPEDPWSLMNPPQLSLF